MTQTHSDRVFAVITAAGSGTRLGSDRPKALVDLEGMSLVERALRNLHAGGVDFSIITAPPDHLDEFNEALSAPELRAISRVVPGSPRSRQASVAAGLDALAEILGEEDAARKGAVSVSETTASAVGENTPVLIHDAARPLVSAQLVQRVIEALQSGEKAVIPGLPVADTLKSFHLIDEASAGESSSARYVDATVDRSGLVAVQTPQGFPWSVIRELHRTAASSGNSEETALTDDAGLAQSAGIPVRIVQGEGRALKITTPIDLVLLARSWLRALKLDDHHIYFFFF